MDFNPEKEAIKALNAIHSFVAKEKVDVSFDAKLPDSSIVQSQLLAKPANFKEKTVEFVKGPAQAALGFALVVGGSAGAILLLPLGLLTAALGYTAGKAVKEITKQLSHGPLSKGMSRASRIGAVTGASLGTLQFTTIVYIGLRLIQNAAKKPEKTEVFDFKSHEIKPLLPEEKENVNFNAEELLKHELLMEQDGHKPLADIKIISLPKELRKIPVKEAMDQKMALRVEINKILELPDNMKEVVHERPDISAKITDIQWHSVQQSDDKENKTDSLLDREAHLRLKEEQKKMNDQIEAKEEFKKEKNEKLPHVVIYKGVEKSDEEDQLQEDRLLDEMPLERQERMERGVINKALVADHPLFNGDMIRKDAEDKILNFMAGTVLMYFDTNRKDIIFSYFSDKDGSFHDLPMRKESLDTILNNFAREGLTAFIPPGPVMPKEITLGESNLELVKNAPEFHGEMEKNAVEEALLLYPPGVLLMYYDKNEQNVIFASRSDYDLEIDHIPMDNVASFEVAKQAFADAGYKDFI